MTSCQGEQSVRQTIYIRYEIIFNYNSVYVALRWNKIKQITWPNNDRNFISSIKRKIDIFKQLKLCKKANISNNLSSFKKRIIKLSNDQVILNLLIVY